LAAFLATPRNPAGTRRDKPLSMPVVPPFPLVQRPCDPYARAFFTPVLPNRDVELNLELLARYLIREARQLERGGPNGHRPPVVGRAATLREVLGLLEEGVIVRALYGLGTTAFLKSLSVQADSLAGISLYVNYRKEVRAERGDRMEALFREALRRHLSSTLAYRSPAGGIARTTVIVDELSNLREQERDTRGLRAYREAFLQSLSSLARISGVGFATSLYEDQASEEIARSLGLRSFALPALSPEAIREVLQFYADNFGLKFEAQAARTLARDCLTPLDLNRSIAAIAQVASELGQAPDMVDAALVGAAAGHRKSTVVDVYHCLRGALLCKVLLNFPYRARSANEAQTLKRWSTYGLVERIGDAYALGETTFGRDLRARLAPYWGSAVARHRYEPRETEQMLHRLATALLQQEADGVFG
jgi:hypothetical protein